MPYILDRVDNSGPSELTEANVRQILKRDYPRQEALDNVWRKLTAGEKIFVSLGTVRWTDKPPTSG